MELDIAIQTRRSIRKYDNTKKVTKEEISKLIEAALMAPSWKNSETGRYYVVMSDEEMDYVRENCMPAYNANNSKDASALIITTFVKDVSGFAPDGTPSNELGNGWGAYDLGLQNQNLLLKAWEMGFGTLVMGLRDADAIRRKFNIPENEIIVSVISVGTPDIEPEPPKRKEIEEVTRYF